jgi:hypothetical protein
MLTFCLAQAAQRLVQLSYAVLERFSQTGDGAAEQPPQQQRQQPQQQLQQQRSSLAAGGGSGNWGSKMGAAGALVPLAPPTVVYTAFAPLVVSTLKVGCAQQPCACTHAVQNRVVLFAA